MKLRNLLVGIGLTFCCIVSMFSLSGCGDVSLSTVKTNFDKLDDTYSQYSQVFAMGLCEGMQTEYLVSYGSIVDAYIAEGKSGYVELKQKFNAFLAISSDYIDNNKEYIKNLTEGNLKKSSKKALTSLNKSLIAYTKSISEFAKERKIFMDYFEHFNGQISEVSSATYLRKFKKSYGNLISKNINLSMNLAKTIETTEIFELLKKTTPTENDTRILKEYIRAKMLPIFSEFMITEIENNLNWEAQAATETKTRIDNLLAQLNTRFINYKSHFVGSSEAVSTLSAEEMTQLFGYIEDFFVETDAYLQALKGLKIKKLAVDYDNDFERYKKSNNLAEVYLEKMEQFVGTTLFDFMNTTLNIIY